MKYTEEIFNILSRGGFISANSVSSTVKRYYDALEEDFTEYYDYYKGIASIWKRATDITFLHVKKPGSIWNESWKL